MKVCKHSVHSQSLYVKRDVLVQVAEDNLGQLIDHHNSIALIKHCDLCKSNQSTDVVLTAQN